MRGRRANEANYGAVSRPCGERAARPIAAVGYAEDALGWWHRRNHTAPPQRWRERDQLTEWRRDHPHDTIRIIREIRQSGRG